MQNNSEYVGLLYNTKGRITAEGINIQSDVIYCNGEPIGYTLEYVEKLQEHAIFNKPTTNNEG